MLLRCSPSHADGSVESRTLRLAGGLPQLPRRADALLLLRQQDHSPVLLPLRELTLVHKRKAGDADGCDDMQLLPQCWAVPSPLDAGGASAALYRQMLGPLLLLLAQARTSPGCGI